MKGKKMCKYKEVAFAGLFDKMKGIPTIQCKNENINDLWVKTIRSNPQKYCCRRLCPFYESR